MDELISLYHSLGLKQQEIVLSLRLIHGINIISIRHLRRKLKRLNLFRRINYTDIFTIANFIKHQISTYGQLHGYRWMHLKCLQHNFVVTRETVRQLLHILDPRGIEIRRKKRLRRRQYCNKGPNFLWHVDCCDKLKPYGVCISGCIDGFSRYIMWLKAGDNSSDPAIIAYHFLETVKHIEGCPRTVRSDLGTENGIIKQIQEYFRSNVYAENNELPPFLYGASPNNQRIEAWWSMLRKHLAQYWMNLFSSLKDDGLFSGSLLDKSLVQFCFLKLIQNELDTVVLEWNMHRISSSRNSICPTGRPFIMYTMPEFYETNDYLCPVTNADINICIQACKRPNILPCKRDICELALILMNEDGLSLPKDPFSAMDLYINLRQKLSTVLS